MNDSVEKEKYLIQVRRGLIIQLKSLGGQKGMDHLQVMDDRGLALHRSKDTSVVTKGEKNVMSFRCREVDKICS